MTPARPAARPLATAFLVVAAASPGCGVEGPGAENGAGFPDVGAEDEAAPAAPVLVLLPGDALHFEGVGVGRPETKLLTVHNDGAGDLVLTGLFLEGDEAFAVPEVAVTWTVVTGPQATGISFDEPILLVPGASRSFPIRHAPASAGDDFATLTIMSNDPDWGSAFLRDPVPGPGRKVALSGTGKASCLSLLPGEIDFGARLLGEPATLDVEVVSCGAGSLEISSMGLVEGSSPAFSLDLGGLPGVRPGGGAIGEGEAPVVLGPGESATVSIGYLPEEPSPFDDLGLPIQDVGVLRIGSDAVPPALDVEVRGFGVQDTCPNAILLVQEGLEVVPRKLHLVGSKSYVPGGTVSKYEWTVEQPPGSNSVFLPSADVPDPTFGAYVLGTYVFTLRVFDENGVESCVPATSTVVVELDAAIHVELVWHTPLDPDETDEGPDAGADLDLHFLHPFATGEDVDGDGLPDGWFDQPFDCFWFNAEPSWGSLAPQVDDDPVLYGDDDGAGPETLALGIPEAGLTYRVGVHSWNDHGFGPSLATIRVWVDSSLAFTLEGVQLEMHDLWEVATIAWPSGDVKLITDAGGDYKILPNYEHPFFPSD